MRTTTIIFIALIVLLFSVGVTAAICIYVYRDAKRRDMSPALWTIVTWLTPGYIGFIIYLIVRNSREITSLKCPSCGSNINKSYFVCPSCGSNINKSYFVCPSCGSNINKSYFVCPYCSEQLKAKCTSCGNVLEAGWETCPFCGDHIAEEKRISPSLRSQPTDRELSTILILIIIIPLILVILTIVAGNIIMFRSPDVSKITQEFALDVNIDISDEITDVYSVQLVYYSDDKLLEASTVASADSSPLSEVIIYSDTSGADGFRLVFNDKYGVIMKSDIFEIDSDYYELIGKLVISDDTGELSLIYE